MNRKFRLSLLLVLVFTLILSSITIFAAPPTGWRQLADFHLFESYDPGGWAGSAHNLLEVSANSTLPVDTAVTYNDLPSLRVNLPRRAMWWQGMVAFKGWATADLSQYLANGSLEFNIKGNTGGENFYIGFKDRVYERVINGTPSEELEQKKLITDFCSVTTSWQHVSIPLRNIIDPNSGFSLKNLWVFSLWNANPNAIKFWVNDVKIISSDNEKGYPAIKVNQLGYSNQAEKYALVTGFDGELTAASGTAFQVKKATDNSVAYSGTLTLITDYDPVVSGERVLNADFSSLTTPGTYYITVNASGISESPQFKIGDDIYAPLLADSLKYYYFQRANLELVSQFAGTYTHEAWHPDDSNCPLESSVAVKKNVSKGWYDAGDYGKYTNAGATAVSDLLWAYETFPSKFTDNHYNIPESGNGVPDILDEARYELDFILGMQDSASGGFYARVFPQNSKTDPRYICDVVDGATNVRPTAVTADAAAVLAHAYLVYKTIDPVYANTMLAAAQKGWTYLENNPGLIRVPSGPYGDDDDRGDRLWAAAALYRATGEVKFNTYFISNYQNFAAVLDATNENAHGVGGMEHIAFLNYMKAGTPDNGFVNWFTAKFNSWRNLQLARSNNGAWRNTLMDEDYYWGSNMPALNTTMVLVIGSKILGNYDSSIVKAARANLNYVLGINPLRFSYVSGYGTDSVTKIFSGIYSTDGKPGIPKGYLAGGPNIYEGKDLSRFAGKCYNDVDTEWTTNEHTIYWNSGLVFSAALVSYELAP
jgi:endoglucanase